MPVSITGRMPTDRAGRYAKQLAQHLSRKIDASFDPQAGHGTIRSEASIATLATTGSTLEIAVTAPDVEQLLPLMGIIQSHLEGFAAKESLTCVWDDPELAQIYQARRSARQADSP